MKITELKPYFKEIGYTPENLKTYKAITQQSLLEIAGILTVDISTVQAWMMSSDSHRFRSMKYKTWKILMAHDIQMLCDLSIPVRLSNHVASCYLGKENVTLRDSKLVPIKWVEKNIYNIGLSSKHEVTLADALSDLREAL
jgi:hypothetical protein